MKTVARDHARNFPALRARHWPIGHWIFDLLLCRHAANSFSYSSRSNRVCNHTCVDGMCIRNKQDEGQFPGQLNEAIGSRQELRRKRGGPDRRTLRHQGPDCWPGVLRRHGGVARRTRVPSQAHRKDRHGGHRRRERAMGLHNHAGQRRDRLCAAADQFVVPTSRSCPKPLHSGRKRGRESFIDSDGSVW